MELTIQGRKVKVDDAFATLTREEQDAVVDDIAQDMARRAAGPTGADFAVQGLSGVNEGIANLAGFATDVANSALSVGPTLWNAATGQDVKGLQVPDAGQPVKDAMTAVGAIKPESDRPELQMTRRIGQEVGATMAPGLGVASRVARPARVLAGEIAGAVGSGSGAAVAEQVAPGNVAAEVVGQVAGGFGPAAMIGATRRAAATMAAPTADALQQAKRVAYEQAYNLGVRYTPQAVKGMTADVSAAVKADNISPTRHPKAFSFVEDMQTRGANGLTLTELDQLRQEVRRDLLRSSDEAEQHFGGVIMDEIDAFIAKAGQGQVSSGNAQDAAQAITTARELNTRWRKTEMLEDAIYAAGQKAAASGSGGNIANTLRQAINSILLNKRRRRAFSADEIKAMEGVVKQGKVEEMLRLVGKLSPQGNGLMLALGIGGTAHNPAMAVFPVVGAVAKGAADRGTIKKAQALRANVARGGNALQPPIMTLAQRQAAGAVALGQGASLAANDNALRDLRMNALN